MAPDKTNDVLDGWRRPHRAAKAMGTSGPAPVTSGSRA